MKYRKMIGLLVVVATALMAFASPASATELTSPKGTKLAVGTVVKASAENGITLDGSVSIKCNNASGEGKITSAGGSGATVNGLPNLVNYTECAHETVTVISTGSGELHSLGNGTGTLTSSGVEVTVVTHTFFTSITIHCIYKTENTHVGTVKDSSVTGGTATVEIGSAPIPQVETDGACGEDAELTGNVKVTTPDTLYID